jgi:7-carboxy-7-deazaguanine synthase
MKITEIFTSIQGETSFAGLPFTFVRLTGCNLRCSYCDTQYAYEGGTELSLSEILAEIQKRGIPRVVITGGEPLLQKETLTLCDILIKKGFTVLLETNGSRFIQQVSPLVHKIVDFKCPGSGMDKSIDFRNVRYLTMRDEVKFVISDWGDFAWAKEIIRHYNLSNFKNILFSSAANRLEPCDLAEWILKEKLGARLQLQLHRFIWPDKNRGV